MRVLHLLNHSLPVQDGYAMRTAAILRAQAARGWQTLQLTSDRHPGAGADEQVGDLHFLRTPRSRLPLAGAPLVEQLATIATLAARIEKLLDALPREQRPDLLHAHSPCLTGLAALRVGRRRSLPVVYEMRSSWEDAAVTEGATTEGSLRYRASRALETRVLKRADAVTTICEGLAAEIRARGVAVERVTVVPNAVDVELFAAEPPGVAALRQQVAPDGRPLIGFIGSFYNWEGLDLLLEAAALLPDGPQSPRVLLIGGGSEEARLQARAAALRLGDRVRFTGRVPHADVHAWYGALDLLVYPRPSTPLTNMVTPLKPLEAMAAGRLVLASDVAGHRELVRDGDTGFLFAAGDARDLAARIMAALLSPERDAIAARARAWVRAERTWTAAVARYVPVYQQLLRVA